MQSVVPLLMWSCNNIVTDQVEKKKNGPESAKSKELSHSHSGQQPTDEEGKQSGSTVQESKVHYSYDTDVYV